MRKMKKEPVQKSTFQKLDEELIEFYKSLKKKNFEEDDIYQIFKPLLEEKKRPVGKYFFVMISVFLFFHIVVKTETGWWYTLAISRIFLTQIKPFYDWSHLKNQECLLPKWWEQHLMKNITPNCNFCENQMNVDVLKYLEENHLHEFYMDVQKPVILMYEGYPTVDHLWSSFFQDDNFLSSHPCSLATNLMGKEGNVGKILKKISIFEDFFVHFQNCEYDSMKYFRNVVQMPGLVPKHTSPVQYNWLIWTKNYTFPKYKKIDLIDSENVKLASQLDGEISYRLSPPEACSDTCGDLEVTLRKGQVLLFTNFWRLSYNVSRNPNTENVGVISEAHTIL